MASEVYVLTYIQLASLLFALNYFPEVLPKRWETISAYVGLCSQLMTEASSEHSGIVILVESYEEKQQPVQKKSRKKFTGKPKECKQVSATILTSRYADTCSNTKLFYQPLLSSPNITSALKPTPSCELL